MIWLLGVFTFLLVSSFLQLEATIITTIAALAGVVVGYYFARDANGRETRSA